MLNLSNLKPKIKRNSRKRVGRGSGSGHGNYSGRGMKGQKSRSGGNIKPGFEGGRMPFIRQIPKIRGFKSFYPKNQVIDLAQVEKRVSKFPVTPEVLKHAGLISNSKLPVKILGGGAVTKKMDFKGVKFSKPAQKQGYSRVRQGVCVSS